MSTYAQSRTDRWVHRSIIVAAGLLALAIVALGGLFVRDRYLQSSTTMADRQVEEARALVSADPENLEARIKLANAYLTKGMHRESLEQFQEAMKRDESDQGLMVGAGIAAVRGKQDDKAIEYFQKLVDLNKDADFRSGNRQLNAVYYELGRLYLNKGQTDKAIVNLTGALRIDKTDSDALLLMGHALAAQGELDKAIEMYRYATVYVPDFVDAYLGMATAAEKKGDAAQAAYARAMVSFSNGKLDEAIKGLEAVMPQLPGFADTPFGLGLAYEAKGDTARALESYRKALEINPQHRVAKSNVERLSQ